MRIFSAACLILLLNTGVAQDDQTPPSDEPVESALPEEVAEDGVEDVLEDILDCIPREEYEEQLQGIDVTTDPEAVADEVEIDDAELPVICPETENDGDGTERGDDAESRVDPADEAAQDESSADDDSGESAPDDEDFTPTEEISEDYPVPLPSDI